MALPFPYDFVVTLMTQNPSLNRKAPQRFTKQERKNLPHHVLECPMQEKCRSGGVIYVARGTGYTNAYNHLKRCVPDGDADRLLEAYRTRLDKRYQHGVSFDGNCKHFALLMRREKSMFSYLTLVVKLSLIRRCESCCIIRTFFQRQYSRKRYSS